MTFSPYFRFRLLVFVITAFVIWNFYKFFWRLPFFQESDKSSTLTTDLAPISVSVFYEALCPDSKNFIVNQLLPTVLNAPKLVNVTFVPYGKAKTDESFAGSLSFSCQHGPVECEANKIHACAIANIPDNVVLVKYISCMISDNMVPELIGENCAKELSIDWRPILHCFKSHVGDTLLRGHGQTTDSLDPAMTFVPTVLLNGKYENQALILKRFFTEVCSLLGYLPIECTP